MIALYLLGLLALASGAPQFYHHRHHRPAYIQDDLFHPDQFWGEMADEMRKLDDMLKEFAVYFPTSEPSQGVVGNEYVITVNLLGYDEKDIVVKARSKAVMIQATHTNGGSQMTYMDFRTLPDNVNPAGSWTYVKGTLKIVFQLTSTATDVDNQFPQVEDSNRSREEMDNNEGSRNTVDEDIDIGVTVSPINGEQLNTNFIPTERNVEGTTYAVDINNEIEFVPVKY